MNALMPSPIEFCFFVSGPIEILQRRYWQRGLERWNKVGYGYEDRVRPSWERAFGGKLCVAAGREYREAARELSAAGLE